MIVPDCRIRICVERSKLNQSAKPKRFQLPSVDDDESLAKLAGARYISKMDEHHGFWQIRLAPESQHLTTLITLFLRYGFRVCPFGINSMPEDYLKNTNCYKASKVSIAKWMTL